MENRTDLILIAVKNPHAEMLDAFLYEVSVINDLVKIRSVLSYGGASEVKSKAEIILSREISLRVTALSASIIECFKVHGGVEEK